MIKSFTITNYLGESIKLSMREPEKSGFLIKEVTGIEPPKANINTSELSTNDGSRYNSARLSERNIVFDLVFVDTPGRESIEDIRLKSYRFFPIKSKVEIFIETDRRSAKVTGYVESNEPTIFSKEEGTQISILCPDPYLYSTEQTTIIYGMEPAFEFPFNNDSLVDPLLVMGDVHVVGTASILYTGDSEVGITIKIRAVDVAQNITITDTKTGDRIYLDGEKIKAITGSDIVEGDEIIINTTRDNKSITLIRGGVSYNILNCVGRNVTWFRLRKGENVFEFAADDGISNLQIDITNQIVYEGV